MMRLKYESGAVGGGDCGPGLFFICNLQVALVSLQEFLSYMESHRQRGHSMFENMRRKHLQVGPHNIVNV